MKALRTENLLITVFTIYKQVHLHIEYNTYLIHNNLDLPVQGKSTKHNIVLRQLRCVTKTRNSNDQTSSVVAVQVRFCCEVKVLYSYYCYLLLHYLLLNNYCSNTTQLQSLVFVWCLIWI
jgi:hypothetical protein